MRQSLGGLAVRQAVGSGNVFVVEAPRGREQAVAADLARRPEVRIAEPDVVVRPHVQPESLQTQFPRQWGPDRINLGMGWRVTTGTLTVTVAIIDSGVDGRHPLLAGRVLTGMNTISRTTDTSDEFGHGTHVAAIAAAAIGSTQDSMTGVAPNVRILPVKVITGRGSGLLSDLIAGIDFAREQRAHVINISLGANAPSALLKEAIDRAIESGAVVVASAGNSGAAGNTPSYPAAFPNVIAVAATDQNDNRASFSTAGEYVSVAAPGVAIHSAYPGGAFATLSGTSMAAPHVAGWAALIRSHNPTLTPPQVRDVIERHVRDLGAAGKDSQFGHGRIDLGLWAQGLGVNISAPPTTPPPGQQQPRSIENARVFIPVGMRNVQN
ncbi:MAG: S8 family peptidase [Dehalococcoidia bacterium]|nr:S8 family peptidase [Dehalococcoidia bacterium]